MDFAFPELSGNVQKSERNYTAAGGHTNNFQGLSSFLNIFFFNHCLSQKIQHKVQDLEIHLVQK